MKKLLVYSLLCLSISIYSPVSYALDVSTHQALNKYIANAELVSGCSLSVLLNNNLGFARGSEEEINGKKVYEWLSLGGLYEDEPLESMPFARSRNHFHNPLFSQNQWAQAGYTGNGSMCNVGHCPESAILWAMGPQDMDSFSPGGDWSWTMTRQNFYAALISASTSTRDVIFAKTFRGLGQLMHLVQDMSVPEHVRNSGHAFGGYEGWVKTNANGHLNDYKPISSQLFGGTITSIASFFDTDQYTGSNPEVTLQNNIGLAEYSNANFVSPNTLFASGFPYPSLASVIIDSETYTVSNPLNGQVMDRPYYVKMYDGETGYLLAGVPFLKFEADKISAINNVTIHISEEIPIMDSNVYQGYAAHLLPRAEGYSAALLNYFFRGTLEISAPDRCLYGLIDGSVIPQQFTTIKAKIKNSSYIKNPAGNNITLEEIKSGALQAVAKYKKRTDYNPDLTADPPTVNSREPYFS